MPKRTKAAFLLCVLLCCALTGCGDSVEVDDDVYAVAIGLDKGINNKLILTIEYPTYKGGGGGGQAGGNANKGGGVGSSNQLPGANIHTVETPSILEGLDIFNMAISRRISLVHIKLLVISEELAREGIGDYLGPLARYRGTRNTLFVLVAREKAVDFIKENKSNIGESLTKSIELMEEQSKKTGYFPDINFHEFYRDVLSSYSEPYTAYVGVNDFSKLNINSKNGTAKLVTEYDHLPGDMPRAGVAKREFVGTAVFDGDKMVGSLNPTETRYMLMMNGKFKRGIFSIEDKNAPGKAIVIDLSLKKPPAIKVRFEDAVPIIDIKLDFNVNIESVQSRIDYEQMNRIDDMSNQIENYLEEGIKKTFEKAQKELKTDVFGFGGKVAGYFTTIQEWEEYNWFSHFSEAKINTSVKVNIRGTGLTLESPPIFSSEGKK